MQEPGQTTTSVIEALNLTKRFGKFTAVDRVSFQIQEGEVFGFLGPNGAGKSTTIRMLCGLLSPSSGSARVGGFDIARDPVHVRQRLGYMSQKFSLYTALTALENIAFFGGVYGLQGQKLRERTQAVITLAGLEGVENRPAGTLSGALQQRLALGCAVLHEPPILFLDEPTSGVDPMSRRMFWDLIQDMAARGFTVLVTTHFMDEAEFCDRIGFISGGHLVGLDTPTALKRLAVQEELFELTLPTLHHAREQVQALDGVTTTSYFGPRLHVFCRPGMYTDRTLDAALRARGLQPESLRPVPVSLEDAFVRLAQQPVPEGAA